MAIEEMKEFEQDGSAELKAHRAEWERRWDEPGPGDATSLRESEEDMIRFFHKRDLGQLDKRCWLIKGEKVKLCRNQLGKLRNGTLVDVEWVEGGAREWM